MEPPRPACCVCHKHGLSELIFPLVKAHGGALGPLQGDSACGNCHCCPANFSITTGGRRRNLQTAQSWASEQGQWRPAPVYHATGGVLGLLGQRGSLSMGMLSCAFLPQMLLPALCLAAEQGMCAFNQTLISSGASRHCLLEVVAVAGYQVLIPASCASLSAN